MNITFRDIKTNDSTLIRNWIITNPYVKKWYYQGKLPHTKSIENKLARRESNPDFLMKIMRLDGVDIGYIQCYPVEGNGNWSKAVFVQDGSCSIDYFIGDIDYIHKGYGEKILNAFISSVVKPARYTSVLISPDPENTANINMLKRCGFKYIKTVNVPLPTSKNKEAVYFKAL